MYLDMLEKEESYLIKLTINNCFDTSEPDEIFIFLYDEITFINKIDKSTENCERSTPLLVDLTNDPNWEFSDNLPYWLIKEDVHLSVKRVNC